LNIRSLSASRVFFQGDGASGSLVLDAFDAADASELLRAFGTAGVRGFVAACTSGFGLVAMK
jgi:hypothetical protein